MSAMAFASLAIYTGALVFITIYCVLQFDLLYHYKKSKKQAAGASPGQDNAVKQKAVAQLALAGDDSGATAFPSAADMSMSEDERNKEYPFVTVQLPLYNEMYVTERLIDCIAQFDYPTDRFEIHVLDDSTDETQEVVRRKVEEYKAKGLQIEQVRRKERKGYKAGALKDGMEVARGEFMAIFDADFLPRPDFLKNTIPHFRDPEIGVVQTRWEHLNEDYSLITQLQALQLNVHFTVEQRGRMAGGMLLQFNGTAGVWRRKAIEDAGGWEADTLTEDFDLSIRAQLKGWKIKFLEEIGSPAELPVEMNALKSQQFRWMKGGAETAKKMLPVVWHSPLSRWKKFHATMHLLGSTIFLFVLTASIASVPLLYFLGELIAGGFNKNSFAYFMIGMLSIISIYYVANLQSEAQRKNEPFSKSVYRFILHFPLFLSLSMGMALHNSRAVLQGYLGKKSAFVRTPKFNILDKKQDSVKGKYMMRKLEWTTIGEGLLALYFLGAVALAFYVQNTTFLVFHLMLAFGYSTIFFYTLRHRSLG
ncbi:MAG: glycosyltransferase [Saprospiraceae bacterium]|jgi:cellulose synthase/poly-beta-1,6-N-acetylglucosamine synthase-like glycosyltransferase|nr:glycosyltransferase [Saprospiraceae bacterium]HRK80774.1 glycosyltransferase family 2 protein [Saprospiraceae bacterium]